MTRTRQPQRICKNPKCGKTVRRAARGESEYCTQQCERQHAGRLDTERRQLELLEGDGFPSGVHGDGFSDL